MCKYSVVALVLILFCLQAQGMLSRRQTVSGESVTERLSRVKRQTVIVTSECKLGTGFYTGHKIGELKEVLTAYHLGACRKKNKAYYSNAFMVGGQGPVVVLGSSPQHDLLLLGIAEGVQHLPVLNELQFRRSVELGEQVAVIGSNPHGSPVKAYGFGKVLYAYSLEVVSKITVPHGSSGGPVVAIADGKVLGMSNNSDMGFSGAVSAGVILEFLESVHRQGNFRGGKL